MQDFYTKSSKSLKEQFASDSNITTPEQYLFQTKNVNKSFCEKNKWYQSGILFNIFNEPIHAHPIVIVEIGDKTFYLMGESIKNNDISQKYTKLNLQQGFGYALPPGIKQMKWNGSNYDIANLVNDTLVNTTTIYCMDTVEFKKLYPNYIDLKSQDNSMQDNFTNYHHYRIYEQLASNLKNGKYTLIKVEANNELFSSRVLHGHEPWLMNKLKDDIVASFNKIYLKLAHKRYSKEEIFSAYQSFFNDVKYKSVQLQNYLTIKNDEYLQNELNLLTNRLATFCENTINEFQLDLKQNLNSSDDFNFNDELDNAILRTSLYLQNIKPAKLSYYNQYLQYKELSLDLTMHDASLLLNDFNVYNANETILNNLNPSLKKQILALKNVQATSDALKIFNTKQEKYLPKITDKFQLKNSLLVSQQLYSKLSRYYSINSFLNHLDFNLNEIWNIITDNLKLDRNELLDYEVLKSKNHTTSKLKR